jgi:pimeloyl-[acyl-carrier protein] methyl ester esterase
MAGADLMSLYLEQTGSGQRDILLIHGWASSGRMWDGISTALAADFRFHALDLAGFGQSPAPVNPPTIADHLAAVIATCDAQQIRPHAVFAHSMGGLIALRLALVRPDLVPVLVLIAPVVTGKFGMQGIGQRLVRLRGADALLRSSESLWALIRHDVLVRLLAQWWHPDSSRAQQIREDFMRMQPAAAIEALIDMAQQDLGAELAQIQPPVLIVVGAQDLTVPPQQGRLAAERLPHATFALIDQARHHPHDEQPAQFLSVVRAFLSDQGLLAAQK